MPPGGVPPPGCCGGPDLVPFPPPARCLASLDPSSRIKWSQAELPASCPPRVPTACPAPLDVRLGGSTRRITRSRSSSAVARARPWRATTEDDGPWHDRRRDSLEFLRSSAHLRSLTAVGLSGTFWLHTAAEAV